MTKKNYHHASTYKKSQKYSKSYQSHILLEPVILEEKVKKLGKELDKFYSSQQLKLKLKPSKILEGAFFSIRPECRSNPDWMSQTANSLRELLYPLLRNDYSKNVYSNLIALFIKYTREPGLYNKAEIRIFAQTFKTIKKLYDYFQNATHHGLDVEDKEYLNTITPNLFEKKVYEFLDAIQQAISLQQLHFHGFIDILVKRNPNKDKVIKDANLFIKLCNSAAKNYFFHKIDEKWLSPLFENGLLDGLKKQPEDTSRYSYNTPEIRYLVRMAKSKNPVVVKKVIKIITDESLATSRKKFNPELIDQIFRILAEWKVKYIVETFKKLKKEKLKEWIKLMAPFGITITFSIERILKTLLKAKEYEWLVFFADCVLAVKNRKDFKIEEIEIDKGIKLPKGEVTPFYISDLEHTEVFETLQKVIETVDINYTEEIFKLLSQKFKEILELANPVKDKKTFAKYDDSYLLPIYSIYLFELKKPSKTDFNYKTKSFFYTLKIAWNKLVEHYKEKGPNKLRKIFENNIGYFDNKKAPIEKLTRSSWVFRLYALSQAPEVFKPQLEKMIFYPLKKENEEYLWQIIQKSEYIKSLQILFPLLEEERQKEYLETIRKKFLTDISRRPEKKKDLREIYGWFFCFLQHFPTFKNFRKKLEKDGFVIPKECNLGPDVGPIITSWEKEPKQPTDITQYITEPIEDFIKRLKTEWKLEKLAESDSLFKPAHIEGIIKKRVGERFEEMLKAAPQFFDRKNIHPHYLYAYLQEILNNLSGHRKVDFLPLFELFNQIQESNSGHSFYNEDRKQKDFNRSIHWIGNWQSVHYVIAEILKEMLKPKDGGSMVVFKKYQESIFQVLTYLLLDDYPDPSSKDDSLDSKKFRFDNRKSNPFMIAINSVRGKAFEALILYVFWDKKRALAQNAKSLMEKIVFKEKTRAMMFMYAYHTPRFHYRDRDWFVKKILPELFQNKRDKYLLLAAEEGYLSQNLYREIFEDPAFQKLYKQWIENDLVDYPNQEHFKHPDDALADHLALAFMFLGLDIDNDLFELFWKKKNKKRWKEFIKFIGITLQNKQDPLQPSKNLKKKLLNLWDWILNNVSDPEVLSAFGYWIDDKIEIFEAKDIIDFVVNTLEKSKGEWENNHALIDKITDFAEVNIRKTLQIIRHFFIITDSKEKKQRSLLMSYKDYSQKIKSVFDMTIKDPTLKPEAEQLISDLLTHLGEAFWELEEVVK